ncbi:MAG TPA: hypothetical protein VFG76_01290, partial [Candidatus Polarisedimenticolia bacterium]|nr:hypothetical protein [Candidatus Polarisedimenticolia bacterium]
MALSKGGAIRSKGAGPRRALSVAAIVVLAHAWIASAYGLTDEDIYGALRIPRSVAGARATAMGGASLALTDDASAASINPARLTALGSPQLAFDLLARNHAQTSSASGFIPFDTSINPFAGTTNSGSFDAQTTTTFGDIAYAHPIKLKRPLVLAISRQEILDVDLDAGAVGLTVPLSAPVTPSGGDEVRRISRGHLEAELDLYHVAAGWKVSPRLSVGGAVVVGNLHLTAETTGLLADPLQFTTVGMVDPRFTGSTAEPLVRTRSDGSDISLGFTLGTQLRVHPTLVLATAYRKGPSFEIPATRRDLSTGRTHSFG